MEQVVKRTELTPLRRLKEVRVGEEGFDDDLIVRFYVGVEDGVKAHDVYFLPMNQQVVYDGGVTYKASYSGNIWMNAIPLRFLDIDKLYKVLVRAKDKMLREPPPRLHKEVVTKVLVYRNPRVQVLVNRALRRIGGRCKYPPAFYDRLAEKLGL